MSFDSLETSLHIEVKTDDGWKITGDAPLPFSATLSADSLSEETWIAYVDYLNVRERDQSEARRTEFRLIRWHIKRSKVIIHV